jgi:hypothetical protein
MPVSGHRQKSFIPPSHLSMQPDVPCDDHYRQYNGKIPFAADLLKGKRFKKFNRGTESTG